MRRTILLAATLLTVAATLGAQGPQASVSSGTDPAFAKFVDDYFDSRFAAGPLEGTGAGFHQYDAKMPDRSRGAIEKRIADLKGQLQRLTAFDRAKLPFADAIDAEALEGNIRSELLDLETLRNWERNPMGYAGTAGFAVNALMKRDFAPKADRLRSITARLKAVPAICAAGKANLKNPPKEFTTLATRMAKGAAGFLQGAVAAWAKDAAGSDAALLAEFTESNGKAVAAVSDFADWLEKDLAPRSSGQYAIGAENYAAKLRYDEMVDQPLSEVLARGEANLARDYAAFLETAKKIDPSKTPAEVMKSLSDSAPDRRGPHPLGPAHGRGRAEVPGRSQDRDDPLRGAAHHHRDAGLRALSEASPPWTRPAPTRPRRPRRSTTSRRSRRTGTRSTRKSTCGSTTRT